MMTLAIQRQAPSIEPFRPVQYLGNKLRSLEAIRSACRELVCSRSRVVDLFTGSTVVAQALAQDGHSVCAVDAEEYAHVFSQSLLGIGRSGKVTLDIGLLESSVHSGIDEEKWHPWLALALQEAALLKERDAVGLAILYDALPLAWRSSNNNFFGEVSSSNGASALGKAPLLTSLYSGTYFGINQALTLDRYLHIIHSSHRDGSIDSWTYNSYLTALMHAASSAAHSAGKHFAQPLAGKKSGDAVFQQQRLIQDRSVSIRNATAAALNRIADAQPHGHHSAFMQPAEDFFSNYKRKVDIFYLDPPYTAQQYSRFYHVLNVMSSYKFPQIVCQGAATTGLYPLSRYKSAFCSKRKALPALRKVLEGVHSFDASAIVSYSRSAAGSDGNARMVDFEELMAVCEEVFGNNAVECVSASHTYRQFNSSSQANRKRNDTEVLIKCRTL